MARTASDIDESDSLETLKTSSSYWHTKLRIHPDQTLCEAWDDTSFWVVLKCAVSYSKI